MGINFFDTANRYAVGNSEKALGRAIKDFARRDDVVIYCRHERDDCGPLII